MPVTRADELDALAERVEKLTGADREIDAEIMAMFYRREQRHIGFQEQQDDGSWKWAVDDVWVDPTTNSWVRTSAKEFTSSFDDAMALAPAGYGWIAGSGRTRPDEPLGGAQITTLDAKTVIAEAEATTPALALTAASLRAQASIIREAGR